MWWGLRRYPDLSWTCVPCDLTRARIPCLEAAYSGALETFITATDVTDPIWIITPPCPEQLLSVQMSNQNNLFEPPFSTDIFSRAIFEPCTIPMRLTSRILWSREPWPPYIPALLTRASTLPPKNVSALIQTSYQSSSLIISLALEHILLSYVDLNKQTKPELKILHS